MLKLLIFCASVLFFIEDALTQNCKADDQYDWSYHGEKNGPDDWVKKYPKCGKKNQSPIEIKDKDITDFQLPKLEYTNFDKPITKAKVQNIGWTVMITPEDGTERYMKYGKVIFILDEIHFHFGSEYDPGAENILYDMEYEMEVHFVTHQKDNSSSVAIVASLMEADADDNSGFAPIVKVLSKVKYRDDSTNLNSDLKLVNLLPKDSGSYYYYDGSDSIPPCELDYFWFILKETGKVGRNQLKTFMTLYSVGRKDASDSCLMGPNHRPVQDLDHRPILASK